MWSNLPCDLLASIFSFLPPDSLARASSVCRKWHTCAKAPASHSNPHLHPPWFLAFPINVKQPCCFAYNPVTNNWRKLSLLNSFLTTTVPISIRPVSTIGSLLLLSVTTHNVSFEKQLGLYNPFTRQFRYLPQLNTSSVYFAVGVTILDHASRFPHFRVFANSGMSKTAQPYEPIMEMYDSKADAWQIVGSVPEEFVIRIICTPEMSESIFVKGSLYWISSNYSVTGFDVRTNTWRELLVKPKTEKKLQFAMLVKRNGALALVGGRYGDTTACVWEMNEGDEWCLVDMVPGELWLRLFSLEWSCYSVSDEDAFYLYTSRGSGMVVCKKVESDEGRWEWFWVDGCDCVKAKQMPNFFKAKGALLHPTLASY